MMAADDPLQPVAIHNALDLSPRGFLRTMKLARLTILSYCLFLIGCVSVPLVEDDLMEPAIDTMNFKCDEPFELTQDCSHVSYAQREISIDGQKMKVAGSENGQIVLVNSATPWADCISNFFLLTCPSLSKKSNLAYVAVREYLVSKGFKITKTVPITTIGEPVGYYVFLKANAYEMLKTLSASDTDDAQAAGNEPRIE